MMKGLIEMALSDPTNWGRMPTAEEVEEIHNALNSAIIESVANPITGNIDFNTSSRNSSTTLNVAQAYLNEIREHYDNCPRSNLTTRQEPFTKSIFILCDCGKTWILNELDVLGYDRAGRIGFIGELSAIQHGKKQRQLEIMAQIAQNKAQSEAQRLAQEREKLEKDSKDVITKFDNPMAGLEV